MHGRKGGDDNPADIAWVFYYYYALLSPLSNYNSEVGFSVTLGLMLGMGHTLQKKPSAWRLTPILAKNLYLEIVRVNKPHQVQGFDNFSCEKKSKNLE